MKTIINRNHDANDTNGGNNAGTNSDLSGLGVGDDNTIINPNNTNTGNNNQNTGNNGGGNNDTETPEAKAAREANDQAVAAKTAADLETAKKFGGVKLDDKGNVVDATGKVVKTAEEIKNNSTTATAVEIDGVQYALDKDGNALDKDGKVHKTKAQLDALSAIDDELPLVDEIQAKSGYKLVDDKGNPKKYEDTPEGLLALATDIAAEKARTGIKKFFDAMPEVEDYAKHIQRGGTKEDYFKAQLSSWSNTKLDEKNETQLTSACVADLMATGMSKEQAEETAKMYKDTDKLKEFGKAAYTRLVQNEQTQKAAADKAYNDKIADEALKTENHWKAVEEVVKKGTLKHITIPETDREAFYAYIAFDADGNGNSKATLDRAKMPTEVQLQLDYLVYKGFDLKTLITNAVKSENVRRLRDRTKGDQQGAGGGMGDNTGKYKPNDVDITLDSVIG
jgi:hypothetical protein